ncbi:sigma-70 family RNA polymerase sigma factor [uncultured Ruminococcus sp.]|uniref:sigma-70 family RNA polymerase sigma factor n=1 Tax=uncultured Ruminococcus sp. TaxID=165186 RepID=UPI002586CA42|nr:sigma-70 family RNA polymerase sigma factor [uncultured Ruminococcus sp.]
MNISHLVEKIKKGDNKSFEKLYKLTEREVWFTCISFLKNETTAQDIMQETYITAFLKIQSLEKSSQIRSWLNRIAVNKCKNYLKGKGEIQLDDEIFENQAIVDERISIPEEYISDKAKREIILSIMQEVLSDVQYQTVIMHYFNEMTVDEIAEVFECSRGTVLSRLNYSRAKMKTAIEDYENKSGDKLHGVVFVPFFTTIFREQAKSLCVPSIKITLPNGESLVTAASKGVSTAIKSSTATAVKTGAVTAAKTKAIAMACGMTLLFAGTTVGTSLLAGYKSDKVPTATTSAQTTAQATTAPAVTVPKAVKDLVDKGEIKVDKDGNITDKNGKKVEVKDGKVEVKTDDGKTVTVKVDDVKTTVSNKNNNNKGNTEKKEDTKSNTSSKKDNSSKTNTSKVDTSKNDNKPASKPSNSSKNDTKPAQKPASKPSESSKTETPTAKPKQKVWVDDYKTVHHEREWIVTGTHEEDDMRYGYIDVCNNCGMQLVDDNQMREHLTWELETNGAGAYHCEKQWVKVGTKTVEDGYWKEAYDEKVKDGGHYEYR